MTSPLDRENLRQRVQSSADALLTAQTIVLAELDEDLSLLLDPVRRLLSGGKRLRAAFAYWGYRAAGRPDSDALVRLATAMELLQAAALLHDDVMDGSATRRGMPSAHRAVAGHHAQAGWSGDSGRFGEATAVLSGNLCLQWTDELYSTCGLPAEHLGRARPMFDRMRTQLMGGQFLDVLGSARGWTGLGTDERIAAARKVIRFKSAKYTIEQPLLVGALAGGLGEGALGPLSAYGLALGEAFQLRDDLLGVFGDPAQTGKPAGDDLREGKRTVLLAHALDPAGAETATAIRGLLGRADLDDADILALRQAIAGTGAVDAVERRIAALAGEALASLQQARGLDPEARDVLGELVDVATRRDA
ncbi:MAG: polyprenyl synthetase family protein [Dermatophilaceae bacterium]